MSLDEHATKELQARGALVGFTNADEWERLVKKHGLGAVCFAVGKARATLKRQPSWQQVEDELPGKAKAAKEETAGAAAVAHAVATPAPAPAEDDDQVDEEVDSVAPAEDADEDLEAAEEGVDEERAAQAADAAAAEAEHPPTAAPKQQPATERKRRGIDWHEVLRANPGRTKRELRDASKGGTEAAVSAWLSSNRDQVVDCGTPNASNKPRRYWLKGDPTAPNGALVLPTPTTEPTTTTKESVMPQGTPCTVDFKALAKELGTFRVAELAKKAKCSIPTARKAVDELEAAGIVARQEAGNRLSPYVLAGRGASGARSAPAAAASTTSGGKKRQAAPERPVKAAAARQEPDPRPRAPAAPGELVLALEGRFDELLERLVVAYTEHHDLAIKPSARRAFLQAATAAFPKE